VHDPAQTNDDIPQRAVVQVNDPPQHDLPRVNAQLVAVLQVVVHHGGQKIVGLADGVHVPHKVKVDRLGGHDLGPPRPCAATLDAEIGP